MTLQSFSPVPSTHHLHGPEPDEPARIDIRALIETLRRQALLIAATVVFFMLGAGIYLFSVVPVYTATALVLADPASSTLLEPEGGQTMGRAFEQSRVDSEVEILRSDAIAVEVVRRAGLIDDPEFGPSLSIADQIEVALGLENRATSDPSALLKRVVDRFRSATDIRRRGLTFVIAVSVEAEDPARAAMLANTLAEAYIDQQLSAKVQASLAARDILRTQIELARQGLERSEITLDGFVDQSLVRLDAEPKLSGLSARREQLAALDAERRATLLQIETSRLALQQEDWAALVSGLEDDALVALAAERSTLVSRLDGTQSTQSLAAIEADLRRTAEVRINGLVETADALEIEEIGMRDALRSDLLNADLPADLLTEMYRIQQDVSVARSQYQSLLSRLRDVEVQAGMQVADSRIVSPALAPSGPSFPDRRVVLGAAIIAALGAGVLLAFLREFFIGGFSTAAHLQDALDAPVASTIPFTGLTSTETTLADKIVNAPLSAYAEAIRRLRASLDQALRNGRASRAGTGKVLLVASTLPGEGKSTTALSLARTYAASGKSVLLIDCDLRKPGIHRLLGVEPHGGFLDYLRAEEDAPALRDFSGVDPYSDLTVVLGKARSALPTDQLLTSARFEKLLQGAKQTFDLVILDSPPLLPVVDARYIAHHADAVLMMVKWASTGQSELRSVLNQLSGAMAEDAVLLGALSHSESRVALSYSGYYGAEHLSAT